MNTLDSGAGEDFRVGQYAPHALQEVAEVAPRLETEQIKFEQGAQQSLLLRKLGEDVEWRKRDVQEECQRRMHPARAQRLSDIH